MITHHASGNGNLLLLLLSHPELTCHTQNKTPLKLLCLQNMKKIIENTLGNLSLLLQIYINVDGLMIESYDIESFEHVVAKKAGQGI